MTTLFHHTTLFVRLNTKSRLNETTILFKLIVSVVIADSDLRLIDRQRVGSFFELVPGAIQLNRKMLPTPTTFGENSSRESLAVANRIDLRLVLHLVVSNHA